jgi:hypothetical protein
VEPLSAVGLGAGCKGSLIDSYMTGGEAGGRMHGKPVPALAAAGVSGPDLKAVVKKFPEMLGCSVESRMRPNTETLAKNWSIKGGMLASTVKRHPQAREGTGTFLIWNDDGMMKECSSRACWRVFSGEIHEQP